MNTQAVSHNHRDWRAGEATRAAVFARIDAGLGNLRACVRWLTDQGVAVQNFEFGRHQLRPRITVAASPLLHSLFQGDFASGQHWDIVAGRTAHDYVAVRYECEVRWSEVRQ